LPKSESDHKAVPGRGRGQSSEVRGLLPRCISELVGTALLVAVGLSVVILDFARLGPVASAIPDVAARRGLTGVLFGATGMSIALSRIGKVSGAHINPVVSIAFFAEGALSGPALLTYVAAQLIGAVLGCVPLLAWRAFGAGVSLSATYPGPAGIGAAFVGETAATFVLITALLSFVGHHRLRRFTPFIFPPMYGIMVWLEAAYSGTSTNPARSLGPDVVALDFHAYWLYWVAPVLGTVLGLLARRFLPVLRDLEVSIARVAHFERGRFEGRGVTTKEP
jgi:aquaporin Z